MQVCASTGGKGAAEEQAHWGAKLVAFDKGGQTSRQLEGACAHNRGVCLHECGDKGQAVTAFGHARQILASAAGPLDSSTRTALSNWRQTLRDSWHGRPTFDRQPGRLAPSVSGGSSAAATGFLRAMVQPRQPAPQEVSASERETGVKEAATSKPAKKGKGKGKKGGKKASKNSSRIATGPQYSGDTSTLAHYGLVNTGVGQKKKGKK